MSKEIETLADRVEELTEELVSERQQKSKLEKSLEGPDLSHMSTQTTEKSNNKIHKIIKYSSKIFKQLTLTD